MNHATQSLPLRLAVALVPLLAAFAAEGAVALSFFWHHAAAVPSWKNPVAVLWAAVAGLSGFWVYIGAKQALARKPPALTCKIAGDIMAERFPDRNAPLHLTLGPCHALGRAAQLVPRQP